VSTTSVYADVSRPGTTEDAPLATPLPTADETDPDNYPGLNVACEQAVERWLPGRALILRPCLVVGWRDPTDRFGYWPARFDRAGRSSHQRRRISGCSSST